jgi:subtilisin family serine protease
VFVFGTKGPARGLIRSVAGLSVAALIALLLPIAAGARTARASEPVLGTGLGSPFDTTRAIGARSLWDQGITGKGVDVAVIDTGIVPVDGLSAPGKVVHGPDLSWESQTENLRYLDTFGHGTHMAGIIAGRSGDARAPYSQMVEDFVGVAPDARIVSVKVADAQGLTDVSQVIAAIDWVVKHRRDAGMNIRVLSLSFGTDSRQTYLLDPLSFAVERAWRKGIVVVVAAGNSGYGDPQLNNPAFNPYVIAVGADDTRGTETPSDDVVPTWSTAGNFLRNPDVVAPGTSVVSLRNAGSYIDQQFPGGRVGDQFFKGSGTSQATAVVSGAVALLLQHRPSLTPDKVKKALTATATRLPKAPAKAQGAGLVNLPKAKTYSSLLAIQLHVPATGLGSLNGARGSSIITSAGTALIGERDIFGLPWLLTSILKLGEKLTGGLFNGSLWSGVTSLTDPVLGLVWQTADWSRPDWTGSRWRDDSWAGSRWRGDEWTSTNWTGSRWRGRSWSGDTWSSVGWGD